MKKEIKLDANGHRKFGIRDSLAYAAGDLGCNMSFALKGTIMPLFWTQVMGLSAWYSLLIVILQFWDAINDPLIGSIVDLDKRKYKRNKFLQYIWIEDHTEDPSNPFNQGAAKFYRLDSIRIKNAPETVLFWKNKQEK